MKKAVIALLLAVSFVMTLALLTACSGGDRTEGTTEKVETTPAPDGTDSAAATEEADTSSETAPVETAPDETYAPIEGLETVDAEFSASDVGTKLDSKEYKLLKNMTFTANGEKLNWYEFYNAAIEGKVNALGEDERRFIGDCAEFFEQFGLEDEAAQARALLSLAEN